MKKPFKVGERVAVYDQHGRIVGVVSEIRAPTGRLGVTIADNPLALFVCYPQQCRRLVKKQRKVYYALIPTYACEGFSAFCDTTSKNYRQKRASYGEGMVREVELVERRRKKS